jgi:hypothetical protein
MITVENSVTKLGARHRGTVLVAGSHGGRYAAILAAKAGVRAVILNDAGFGRDRAGVSGLALLEGCGIAGATAAHSSCRIGDGADTHARGVVSALNGRAAAAGVAIGMAVGVAAEKLAAQAERDISLPPVESESRTTAEPGVLLLDSTSLVEAGDAGSILLCGSHGGLLGGDPATACRVDVFAAVFNDAGVGIDAAGIARLPALERRGIAAATVSAASARIGEARSTYEDGVVSHLNPTARRYGGEVGISARELVRRFLRERTSRLGGSSR